MMGGDFCKAPHSFPPPPQKPGSAGGMESNKHRVVPAAAGGQNVLLGCEKVGCTMTCELIFY